jgi:hypothetical protein
VSEEVVEEPVATTPAPAEPVPTQFAAVHARLTSQQQGPAHRLDVAADRTSAAILGGIGVVLRGGGVDGDECDPRTDGRRIAPRSLPSSINNRIPVIRGRSPGREESANAT